MKRYVQFVERFLRARRYGIRFRGMSHTVFPARMKFGGAMREMQWSDEPLAMANFVNVVLDDEYGLRGFKRAPAAIVDVGANIGKFCNWARDCFPDAVIHGYEPSPETARMARHNTQHPRTVIYEEGVAAHRARADIVELGASTLSRTSPSSEGAVQLIDFATVIERIGGRIDLLKVDCEGAEWDFMRDPQAFANVGCVRMEYHLVDGKTIDDVRQLAADLGFRLTRLEQNQGFGIAWMDR